MPTWPSSRKRLLWLLGFNAVSAISGGLGMVTDAGLIPPNVLDGTPFDTFTIPGNTLLWVVGGSSTLAFVLALRHHPLANEAALGAAAILAGWLLIEFYWIPEGWAFQYAYLVVAAVIAESALAERQRIRSHART